MDKEVLFEPFPKQIEFLKSIFSDKYNFIVYGGAIRGGKTFAGLGALLLLSKKYPKSKWVIVRDSLQTLKRTTIPSFFKICPNSFISKYNQETQTVTFTNGSQIIFFGENFADDKELNRFKGLECNGFLFEEINECQKATFYKAIERAGSHVITNAPKPLILATCNPTNNWVKDLIYDEWKRGELPYNWHYIPSKITDNPFIPQDYLESLKSMPRYEYQVFVEGDWDLQQKTGAEFYKEFNLDKHVKKVAYKPELPVWLSIDENVHPYFSCTVWQIEGKRATQIDELCMRNPFNTITGMCNEIKKRYPNHTSGMLITGDATSNKEDVKLEKGFNLFTLIRNELEQYRPQLRQPKSNPSVYVRGQFINTCLYSNFGGIEIVIGENCKESINDLVNTKQDSDGTKFKKKVSDPVSGVRYEEHGHLSDCFIGETIVETINGGVRIDEIKVGDLVLTRNGYKRVLRKIDKGVKSVNTYFIGDKKLTCTDEHKIFTYEAGFKEINSLTKWITFCIFEEKKIWKKKLFIISEKNSQDTQTQQGVQKENIIQEEMERKKSGFTFSSMRRKLVQFLLDFIYIIKMEIAKIMKLKISNVSALKNTCETTIMNGVKRKNNTTQTYCLQWRKKKQNYGILQKLVNYGTVKMQLQNLNPLKLNVVNVVMLQLKKLFHVSQNFAEIDVEKGLRQEHLERREKVYDLTVEDEHEYFANGILVHNCGDYLLTTVFNAEFIRYQGHSAIPTISSGNNMESKRERF